MVDREWDFLYWDDFDDEWVDENPKWKSDSGKTIED